jgi:hypothetical protein
VKAWFGRNARLLDHQPIQRLPPNDANNLTMPTCVPSLFAAKPLVFVTNADVINDEWYGSIEPQMRRIPSR